MFRIFITFFCFFSIMSFANDYKVSLLDLESSPEVEWGITAINDKGQVLGTFLESPYNRTKIYLFDSKNGLTFIESKDQSVYPITTNNVGQVLGYGDKFWTKPFIWTKTLGLRWLDIFNNTNVIPKDLNDLGQIIGSYGQHYEEKRPFMWDDGVVTDMGPGSDFCKSIESLGYHIL